VLRTTIFASSPPFAKEAKDGALCETVGTGGDYQSSFAWGKYFCYIALGAVSDAELYLDI